MVYSRAADAEESEECAPARPADHKCNILRVADRDPVARFARTLRPVHECVQRKRIFDALAAKSRDSLYLIDSTIVKAHRAAKRRKRGEKNQAIGISRGGRTTKIHAVVDGKGRPLNFIVTGGQG